MEAKKATSVGSKKQNTIRRRWVLTLVGVVVVFAVISTMSSLRIGLWSAQFGAREWLTSNHIESIAGYNALIFERLEREAASLHGSDDLARALAAEDARAIREAVTRARPLGADDPWIVVTRAGRALSNIDACRSGAVARELASNSRRIIVCGETPLLVATSPVVTPRRPRIFAGQRLDDAYVDGLRWVAKTEVALLGPSGYVSSSVRNLAGERMPMGLSDEALEDIVAAEQPHFGTDSLRVPSYQGYILGSGVQRIGRGASEVDCFYLGAPLRDEEGMTPLRVVYAVPRFVMEQGPIYATSGLAVLSVILVIVLALVGWRLVIRFTAPLQALTQTAARVAAGEFEARASVAGGGELESLAETFNAMVEQLAGALAREQERALEVAGRSAELEVAYNGLKLAHEELGATQARLVDASRRAGMADMAASVLHNVGNVLNSVNVSASTVADGLRSSKIARMRQAVRLLERPADDLARFVTEDPKGKQVLAYLGELASHLEGERANTLDEVDKLCRHVEHVKRIVAMQQAYAGSRGVMERIVPSAVVEDALRLAASADTGRRVTIERRLDTHHEVVLDRHKLMQILVNLLRNAAQAVQGTEDPRIIVRTEQLRDELIIQVEDNGVGIAAENLTRIFEHGFTTKRDGHGFGLHSSALAANEMGGSLQCESAGPGRGARFRVSLPAAPAHARCA